MSFSRFKQKGARTPDELVRQAKAALLAWAEHNEQPPETESKVTEKSLESLDGLKTLLSSEGSADEAADLLAEAACREGFIEVLLTVLPKLDFQGRRMIASLFSALLRQLPPSTYLEENTHVLEQLIEGYSQPLVALFCGSMLRDCARHASLTRQILSLPSFFRFFDFTQSSSFEVSCDAFTTFKELLIRHPEITTPFLVTHYPQFFELYRSLLVSDNYVTKRQSLKFLGELLLARAHVAVLVRYIADVHNLRLLMILLKDPSKSVQFEAFHVFKVFVANPNKEAAILRLLCKNKHKLLAYLQAFQQDREDEQFEEEKALLVKEIHQLPEASPTILSDRDAAVD